MSWDQLAGGMTVLRGRIREWWGRLIRDDSTIIAGRRDQLIGLIQQRDSMTLGEIEQQIGSFERRVAQHR